MSDFREELRLEHLREVPLREGYTRIYEDHTGRNFHDFSPEEMESNFNDPFMTILREEIQKEINNEILKEIKWPLKTQ